MSIIRIVATSTSETLGDRDTYHDAKHRRRGARQTVTRSTIFGREYLCRDGIEHAVQHLLSRSSNELGWHRRVKDRLRRTLLQHEYPQFHPRSWFDVLEVVLARRNAPVSALFRGKPLSDQDACVPGGVTHQRRSRGCLCVRCMGSRRPTPQERRRGCRAWIESLAVVARGECKHTECARNAYVAVGDIKGSVSECGTASRQASQTVKLHRAVTASPLTSKAESYCRASTQDQ